MNVNVVNLDTQPDRWATMQHRLSKWPDLAVSRWPAVHADTVTVTHWRSTAPDPARRIAIIRSYRTLFEHLADRDDGPWLILQDDIQLTRHPHRTPTRPVHLYGGYHTARRHHNPPDADHICPKAFLVTAEAVPPLLDIVTDEHDQMCVLWAGWLTTDTCTWDAVPSAV